MAILNLGNVGFGTINAKGGDKVPSPSKGTSDFLISVGKLLQIDLKKLIHAMTKKRQTIGKDIIDVNFTLE